MAPAFLNQLSFFFMWVSDDVCVSPFTPQSQPYALGRTCLTYKTGQGKIKVAIQLPANFAVITCSLSLFIRLFPTRIAFSHTPLHWKLTTHHLHIFTHTQEERWFCISLHAHMSLSLYFCYHARYFATELVMVVDRLIEPQTRKSGLDVLLHLRKLALALAHLPYWSFSNL